jgi:hypothetical protein
MTGTIKHQIVIRNKPGMMMSTRPIAIAIEARIDAIATEPRKGAAAQTV